MQLKEERTGNNLPVVTKSGLSYGWIVAIVGAYIVLLGGNFQYTFGVFVKPLIDKFGWSRAAISGGVTARSITAGVLSPIFGALGDRYGHRKFILTGILVVGVSFLLTAYISTLWQLYIFLGVLAGLGISMIFVPMISITTRWFGAKSSLANGIILSGYGWAQIVIPPAVTYLILDYSWEVCCIVLGIVVIVTGVIAWFFIRLPQKGTVKLPGEPEKADTSGSGLSLDEKGPDFSLPEALRTPALWQLVAILLISAACFQLVVIHIVIAAIDTGVSAEAAAIILTISGITNTSGRIIIGYLATRISSKAVLVICLLVQALVLFIMASASELQVFYILAAVYGLVYGGMFPLIPTLTASFFGTRTIGSTFGIVNMAYPFGGAIGPLFGGYIFDMTQSYYAAFISATGATLIVLVISLLLKVPRRKRAAA